MNLKTMTMSKKYPFIVTLKAEVPSKFSNNIDKVVLEDNWQVDHEEFHLALMMPNLNLTYKDEWHNVIRSFYDTKVNVIIVTVVNHKDLERWSAILAAKQRIAANNGMS